MPKKKKISNLHKKKPKYCTIAVLLSRWKLYRDSRCGKKTKHMEPEERGMYKVYGPGVHRHIKYVLQQKNVTWCWVLGGLRRGSLICGNGLWLLRGLRTGAFWL